MTRPVLRRSSYDLSEEQTAVRDAFASFFAQECPTSRVRDADGAGFDAPLWRRLVDLGGGSLVDVVLIAQEAGRTLAPVPLVEAVVVARALARSASAAEGAASRAETATFAPAPKGPGIPQLLGYGAHAATVLALSGARPPASASATSAGGTLTAEAPRARCSRAVPMPATHSQRRGPTGRCSRPLRW